MKILFCSPVVPSRELGIPKVLIELAEALEVLRWQCTILSPADIFPKLLEYTGAKYQRQYAKALKKYLQQYASHYNVVDYDHLYLPYQRAEFSPSTLFVARSALLVHHFKPFPIPTQQSCRGRIGYFIKEPLRKIQLQTWIRDATLTMQQADLINVNNDDAKENLIQLGIPSHKIVSLPLGISKDRRPLFNAVSSDPPEKPKVAFVGTFDPRKGSNDLPKIVQEIVASIPDVSFRLMGAKHKTESEILSHFPSNLTSRIEVIPSFTAEELPHLLSSCSVGIFPSYLEGFGLGILEMLAASIPVVAYNVPGPSMMLPPDYLIPKGNIQKMSQVVVYLLQNQKKLKTAREWAKQRSQDFCWQKIAQETSQIYQEFSGIKKASRKE